MNVQAKLRHPRRRAARLGVAYCIGLAIAGPVCADAVTDWNLVFDQASPAFGGPPARSPPGAMMHVAIHDALNSIDPRYQPYTALSPANPNASPDAAIAAAARDVLINQLSRLPDNAAKAAARTNVQSAYVAALAAIPDGTAENLGVAAGQAAAAAIIALRLNDGQGTPNLPYTLAPGLGVYQPTPPNFATPSFAGLALWTPFAMTSASQFHPGPSPIFALKGAPYARDYNEVKAVGSAVVRNAAPDSEESRIARFFPGGGGNGNALARAAINGLGLDRWQHARLFALRGMAETDALITAFGTKYVYNFWRPVTAIRWADDGNRRTEPDPGWLSYQLTPAYPDYICGLPSVIGSTTEVLRRFFGTDDITFSFTVSIPQPAPAPPEVLTRNYTSLSQAANEAVDARVFGGMHFRDGCEQAKRTSSKVASYVFARYLKPVQ
ncbi:vanadium-dependent haloperoxidase [Lysobacter koreensis]|uniref:Vanadium-dependent haloperoxidase n=1 Tax=Lysobacter koreensis TaxID=266122 RepID=A0ABW2YUH8_9GAMM